MTQNQICSVRKILYSKKITMQELANDIGYSRQYVSMALNGKLQLKDVDNKILEWYKEKKQK